MEFWCGMRSERVQGRGRTFRTAPTLLVLLLALGCISPGLRQADLPDEPIAFLHWSRADAKKRSSIFKKAAEAAGASSGQAGSARYEEDEIKIYLRGEKTVSLHHALSEAPGHLMLVWPSTGVVERVEAAPLGSRPLAWSPDHRRLLFVSAHRGGKDQLYLYDLDRRDLSPITVGPDEHARGDFVSDQVILHRSRRTSVGKASLMTLHRAGLGGRLGAVLGKGIPPGSIRFLPGSEEVVYEQVRARHRHGRQTIYDSAIAIQSLDDGGGEERILAKGREPTLTPDGEWIVFASPSSAGYRLRRMRPDGTSRVPINPGGTEERMPSVSPDGRLVVFVQMVHERRILTLRSFDGKREKRLVPDGWSEFPVW